MNKRASILMINLWILALLVIFALGLGHRALINLRLLRYQRDALKAGLFADAGINKVIALLVNADTKTTDYDTIEECGITIPESKTAEDIFTPSVDKEAGRVKGNEGFRVGYNNTEGEFTYGITDEERKVFINIKTDPVNEQEKAKITNLLQVLEIADPQDIADTIIDWIDSDKETETDKDQDKAIFKNQQLAVPEEMLLILEYFYIKKGSSREEAGKKAVETYLKVKDFITVYGEGKININTASREVLTVLGRIAVDKLKQDNPSSTVYSADVDTLVNKINSFRNDGGYFDKVGKDEIKGKFAELSDNEKSIIDKWADLGFLSVASDNFRIQSQGYINKVIKNRTIVYSRKDGSSGILHSRQN